MAPIRVLVIDDNESHVVPLCGLLTLWGYLPESAPDGRSALRASAERAVDIAIVDLILGDCDGVDLIPILKARGTRVVVFSGSLLEKRALAAGADAFVLKPDIDRLEEAVRVLASRAAPEARAERMH